MLKGINKILTGELLKELCDMGHGDKIAIVDANYPAAALNGKVIRYPGKDAVEVLKAVTGVFPLDHITAEPVLLMDIEEGDRKLGMKDAPVWAEFLDVVDKEYGTAGAAKVSRERFYGESRGAFCIVQTGEERLYGNIILVKGVVRQDG